MAKNDNELFDRLRRLGIRRQVAKTLSEIGEGAGKKARNAARSAVSELRSVADEIERRMPGGTQIASAGARTTKRSAAAKPRTPRSRSTAASPTARARRSATTRAPARAARAASGAKTAASGPKTAASGPKTAASSRAKTAAAPKANGARAPRGQNKAKILASLKSGPKTASVIAKETGIGTGTVGSTLSKLATSGEVVKAERGYGLPS
jgi:hypothetical protein